MLSAGSLTKRTHLFERLLHQRHVAGDNHVRGAMCSARLCSFCILDGCSWHATLTVAACVHSPLPTTLVTHHQEQPAIESLHTHKLFSGSSMLMMDHCCSSLLTLSLIVHPLRASALPLPLPGLLCGTWAAKPRPAWRARASRTPGQCSGAAGAAHDIRSQAPH